MIKVPAYIKTILYCSVLVLFFDCSKTQKTENPGVENLKIIGYVAGYENFDPALVDATKLTHINYAFANIVDGKPQFELDIDSLNISKLIALKKTNPNLKLLYSIGGWVWSNNFSHIATDEKARVRWYRFRLGISRTAW